MGFISFNEAYYREKLAALEGKTLSAGEVYEAKQLLKVLDDLTDEGYTGLNAYMEREFSCLTRLRSLLRRAGASPFPVNEEKLQETAYAEKEYELTAFLKKIMEEAKESKTLSDNTFIKDILAYCRWLEGEEDAAYVFLLRDTLLPYAYFCSRGYERLYPWLLSRRSLADISKTEGIDDAVRFPVYEALGSGLTDYEEVAAMWKERIPAVLDKQQILKNTLLGLLGTVKEKRIIVVESGYVGTVPMLLKALDDRVSVRLYTTAPYLYGTYAGRIFCRRYEDIRRFETLCAQDRLLQYAGFCGGKFFVRVTADETVRARALAEIKSVMM